MQRFSFLIHFNLGQNVPQPIGLPPAHSGDRCQGETDAGALLKAEGPRFNPGALFDCQVRLYYQAAVYLFNQEDLVTGFVVSKWVS